MSRCAIPWLLLAACGFSAPTGGAGGAPPDAAAPIGTADAAAAACIDANQDGACDDQTWRCGAVPSEPSKDPLWGDVGREAWWSHDATLGGQGRLVVAAPGGMLPLSFRFDWQVDCPGTTCQAQLEVGLVTSGSSTLVGCAADKTVQDRDIEWGHDGAAMISIPQTPAIYDVRLQIGKSAACGSALSMPPAASQTIARICVPP